MTESDILFKSENLWVKYPNGEVALHDVDFEIEGPSFIAVIGPNGSGKSTLVKTALGLLKPYRGHISLFGFDSMKETGEIRRRVRYVPQRDRIDLNIPMKVIDIVLMGRLLKKSPPRIASSKDKRLSMEALEKVNMDELWKRPFPELSGGQRQRVLVARALASEGQLLLLDEPLAGTDVESQNMIVEALRRYHEENDVSVIMVTHDLNPVHTLVQDVLLLQNTVIGVGTPCSIMDPELLQKVYGPDARVVEYAGHRYCVTRDSGIDRHA
ncbi:metal ABC transporter ATP-binding protein [Candidatus Thorarchaeota archaeon]|nr:MAG: metal ABC transporter ATP-binding protein [Candidatus Thorarchaeota archaeon]